MIAVEVKNITKSFEDGVDNKIVLNSVSFDIEEGKYAAITGKSGSGKSTLLNILSGLDVADSGEITVCGKRIDTMSEDEKAQYRAKDIGFVFQSFYLIPVINVWENIVLPAKFSKFPIDEKYVDELMGLLEITDKKNCMPSILSGGEQQRVAIARALVNRPKVVFADEPTGNLDMETGRKVLDLFLEGIKSFHQTLIVVTHDKDIADRADVVIKMSEINR